MKNEKLNRGERERKGKSAKEIRPATMSNIWKRFNIFSIDIILYTKRKYMLVINVEEPKKTVQKNFSVFNFVSIRSREMCDYHI